MWRAESSNIRLARCAELPDPSGAPMPIATPCCTRRLAIVVMSTRSGRLARTNGSAVNRLAAISGSAAFLAPPILIVPDRGTPPRIRILSIVSAPGGDDRRAVYLLRERPAPLKKLARRRPLCPGAPRHAAGAPASAPCGGADCRAARGPDVHRARHARPAGQRSGGEAQPSPRWKASPTPLSMSGAISRQSRSNEGRSPCQAAGPRVSRGPPRAHPGCRSSVVEHPLGKGEVESSILSGSTMIQFLFELEGDIDTFPLSAGI